MFLNDLLSKPGHSWAVVETLEGSQTDPWMYACNVSISPVHVTNALVKEHLLGVTSSADDIMTTQLHQFQISP